MHMPAIPLALADLTDLEARLIARRILFMKIFRLPRGAHQGIKGSVVNVPADLTKIVSVLPRIPSQCALLGLKLKRDLRYKSAVSQQTIRPHRVLEALEYLILNKPEHYGDISINKSWIQHSKKDDNELWNALATDHSQQPVADSDQSPAHSVQSQNSDSDSDTDLETEDEETTPPLDSCLQPTEGPLQSSTDIISVAPGEGQTPLSLFTDNNSELLAFPRLFPKSSFGYSAQRPIKLTLGKYFNARMFSADTRFAESLEYLFYAQYMSEAKHVMNNISIVLRKSRPNTSSGLPLTASTFKSKEAVSTIVNIDEGFRMLKSIRGTPPYWQTMQFDMLAKIKQLGPFTWFITFSVADMRWNEIIRVVCDYYGETKSDDDITNMNWSERCMYIKRNPVLVARHIDYMFHRLFHNVILSAPHPVAQVLDYEVKKEFQARGSVHFHLALWVKDAPVCCEDNEKQVVDFIDKYVACKMPNDNDVVTKLVTELQTHHHTRSCTKHNSTCRFGFPKPPLPYTMIARKVASPELQKFIKESKQLLASVYKKLKELSLPENITLTQLLDGLNYSKDQYCRALAVTANRTCIYLQRTPQESYINNYNAYLLSHWQANMDIQFVTDAYACVMYLVSYLCKSESGMSQLLRIASKEANADGVSNKLRRLDNTFLNHRELSAQEAVYRLLSLPLRESSRHVVYIPTGYPQHRTRILKQENILLNMPDNSKEIFQLNILDKYSARPTQPDIESCCLAEFSSNYSYSSKQEAEDGPNDHTDDDQGEVQKKKQSRIRLLSGHFMVKRTKPAVIRYHVIPKTKDRQQHFYNQLLLYFPWRDETRDLSCNDGNYKQLFQKHHTIIEAKMCAFERHSDYAQVAQTAMEEGNSQPEDVWNEIATDVEQSRMDNIADRIADEDYLLLDPDVANVKQVDIRANSQQPRQFTVEFAQHSLCDDEYYDLLQNLSPEQYIIHEFVNDWCSRQKFAKQTGIPVEPFYIFLTGGAGVGKSQTIKAIYHTAVRSLRHIGQNPDELLALLTAPMGTAAYNIGGMTLHSAFLLPCKMPGYKTDVLHSLSQERRNTLRCQFQTVKLLIIDEVSMVGAQTLHNIHSRLQEIVGVTNSTVYFGGLSILAVGDLFQLPPVGASQVFDIPSGPLARLHGSLWPRLFKIVELKTVFRQQHDMTFANILNRVRVGQHTEHDLEVLNTRQVTSSNPAPPSALHIFPLHRQVEAHNSLMLASLSGELVTIQANDSNRDRDTGILTVTARDDIHETGGLHKILSLKVGARISLTRNIDVGDGLVNGAQGTVVAISIKTTNHLNGTIHVRFDKPNIGAKARIALPATDRQQGIVHIKPETATFQISSFSSIHITRTQYPLTLAWAATIHKVQGASLDEVVVSFEDVRTLQCGQAYVALARAKTLQGLYIQGLTQSKIHVNKKALDEMQSMNNSRLLNWFPPTMNPAFETSFKLVHLNCRSLRSNWQNIDSKTPSLQQQQFLLFQKHTLSVILTTL